MTKGPALVQRGFATESAAAPASPRLLRTEQGWGTGGIAGVHPGDSLPGQPAEGTSTDVRRGQVIARRGHLLSTVREEGRPGSPH